MTTVRPSTDRTAPPKRLVVRVTAGHIKDGVPMKATFCPLALALREQTKGESTVLNFHAWAYRRSWKLSHAAQQFVSRFDGKQKVKPSTFVLRPTHGS